jgi:hypothetical protein
MRRDSQRDRTTIRRRGSGWIAAGVAAVLAAGCTAVDPAAVKADRAAGIQRGYDRPPAELYQAAVLGLESLRDDPNWRDLEIVERDAARGTVIAERNLDSAVIPGLGEKDAIGVFVAAAPGGGSEVTVVRMSSDQFPGSAGTTVNSARDASGLIFPAIDRALESVPEGPRPRVAAAPSPAAPAPAGEIDRLYAVLRDAGTWRPLVREVAADGGEEIRVGSWAVLTADGDRVRLRIKSKNGSAVDAARLALELERAGFRVDVAAAPAR